jgi:hypothetical protein
MIARDINSRNKKPQLKLVSVACPLPPVNARMIVQTKKPVAYRAVMGGRSGEILTYTKGKNVTIVNGSTPPPMCLVTAPIAAKSHAERNSGLSQTLTSLFNQSGFKLATRLNVKVSTAMIIQINACNSPVVPTVS